MPSAPYSTVWRAPTAVRTAAGDGVGVVHGREFGEPHAVRVGGPYGLGGLLRQPGLARPARAEERHQAGG